MKNILESLAGRVPLSLGVIGATFLCKYQGSSILSTYKPILTDLSKAGTLLMISPFRIGDTIGINAYTGRVSNMCLRYITLENKESTIYIPTHTVYGSVIKKYK
ncbi:hypothetical protein NEOKW01_2100 [Nematocida sp. AWRm80]|nr:hypothetical protein NEOKW01_2100 [Nematocida sp. AWRm80]